MGDIAQAPVRFAIMPVFSTHIATGSATSASIWMVGVMRQSHTQMNFSFWSTGYTRLRSALLMQHSGLVPIMMAPVKP